MMLMRMENGRGKEENCMVFFSSFYSNMMIQNDVLTHISKTTEKEKMEN